VEELKRDLENLNHAVADLITIYNYNKIMVDKLLVMQDRLEPRIERLIKRQDAITIRIGDKK